MTRDITVLKCSFTSVAKRTSSKQSVTVGELFFNELFSLGGVFSLLTPGFMSSNSLVIIVARSSFSSLYVRNLISSI